jgi:hypothetical protein
VNPLQKARDGAGSAWAGTKRTAGWVKGGIAGATAPVRDGLAGAWDRVGGGSLMHQARSDSRIGAGLIIGAILVVLWIAWTVYVWTENGTAAGLGVLISWPAVIVALALVAAPFVGAVVLVRRLAANGGPTLAVAGGGTAEPHAADEVESGEDSEGEDDPAEEAEDEEGEPDEEAPDDSGDGDGDGDGDGEPEDDEPEGGAEATDDAEGEGK